MTLRYPSVLLATLICAALGLLSLHQWRRAVMFERRAQELVELVRESRTEAVSLRSWIRDLEKLYDHCRVIKNHDSKPQPPPSANTESQISALVESIRREERWELSPENVMIHNLVGLLRIGDAHTIDLLKIELGQIEEPVVRGNLLYALYAGTRDPKWLDMLLGMAAREASSLPKEFWRIFADADFQAQHIPRVWDTVAQVILTDGFGESLDFAALMFFDPDGSAIERFAEHDQFFDLVEMMRDTTLDPHIDASRKRFSIRALRGLSSHAFAAAAAALLADKDVPLEVRAMVTEQVATSVLVREDPWQGELPSSYDYSVWRSWLEDQPGLRVWLEEGLSTLRASDSRRE